MEEKVYPSYIQKRIDSNNARIKEIKKLIASDEDTVDIYEEMIFLKQEIDSFQKTDYTDKTSIEKKEILPFDIDYKYEQPLGSQKETEARIEFGEYLYQVPPPELPEEILDDIELFKKYNISFINGLPVNIDVELTPHFVMERIRKINPTDRLKLSKNQKFLHSDTFSNGEKLDRIYFESEINESTFNNLTLDETIEDRATMKKYKDQTLVLIQMKPDYTISNDFRYTVEPTTEGFENTYIKLADKSEEFGIPTYKQKKSK